MSPEPQRPSPQAADIERLYLGLLNGVPTEDVTALERLELVARDPAGLPLARPPRRALEQLARRYESEAAQARESAELLGRAYAAHAGKGLGFVEFLHGTDEVLTAHGSLAARACVDIRSLERGSGTAATATWHSPCKADGLRRGATVRTVYDVEHLQTEAGHTALASGITAGEEARAFLGVPFSLLVTDQAIIVVSADREADAVGLLVHPSPLLDAVVELFEVFWRMGTPVCDLGAHGDQDEPTPQTVRLLMLLSAGMTDESIARELHVSERTVHRRVSRLLNLLGARTRFQLGEQASRRNWI